ncbi:MAG TPA: hypothetical protein DCG37_01015 [Lachnospiraceae bacterium]|nr:hypothetical protein [Lachnospiraceae bacterium]
MRIVTRIEAQDSGVLFRRKGAGKIAGVAKFFPAVFCYTQKRLRIEYCYIRAERFTRKLLKAGKISPREFECIMAENRRTFPTFLSPLL